MVAPGAAQGGCSSPENVIRDMRSCYFADHAEETSQAQFVLDQLAAAVQVIAVELYTGEVRLLCSFKGHQ